MTLPTEDIKRLQARVGVEPDGEFGPATLAAVNAALDRMGDAKAAAVAAPEPTSAAGGPISLVTADLIRIAVPTHPDPEAWVEPIRKACRRFEINTVRRVASFIAQMAH